MTPFLHKLGPKTANFRDFQKLFFRTTGLQSKLKKLWAPIYEWGSTISRFKATELLQGEQFTFNH